MGLAGVQDQFKRKYFQMIVHNKNYNRISYEPSVAYAL